MKKRVEKKLQRGGKIQLINVLFGVILLASMILIFNQSIRNIIICKNIDRYQINKVSSKSIKENSNVKGKFDFDSIKPVSLNRVVWSNINKQPLPVIGEVAVPDVGINLPIFKGLTNDNVSYGAGTMKKNQVMGRGNYALASHNVSGFNNNTDLLFTPLEHAKKGTEVYITDKENIYQYRVDTVEVVSPEHTEVIEDHIGKTEITLVTCADSKAKNRIIVHGLLEKQLKYSKITMRVEAAFSKAYNQIL